jgi:hypothetical protein
MPLGNTLLAIQEWRSCNTVAAAVGMDFVETNIATLY